MFLLFMKSLQAKEFLLLPNFITFLRLLLAFPLAFFIYHERWWYSALTGSVAIISDFLDGAVARRFNMQTDFGRKFDPTVDKIVLISIFFIFFLKELTPLWFSSLMLLKDLSIPIILLLGKLRGVELNFSPTKLGKSAVASQFSFIILFIIWKIFDRKELFFALQAIMFPVAFLCILSILSYVFLISKLVMKTKMEQKIDI